MENEDKECSVDKHEATMEGPSHVNIPGIEIGETYLPKCWNTGDETLDIKYIVKKVIYHEGQITVYCSSTWVENECRRKYDDVSFTLEKFFDELVKPNRDFEETLYRCSRKHLYEVETVDLNNLYKVVTEELRRRCDEK